jgi:MoaA/NifB/PqqE/SkfB family radical SAM enzyme
MLKRFLKRHLPFSIKSRYLDYRENKRFKRAYHDMLTNKRHLNLRMDTNNVCNLKCVFCDQIVEVEKPRFMTLGEFKYVAQRLFPITNSLALSCATEPTMTKNFSDFIKIAGAYDIPFIEYTTNGLLLNEDLMRETILNKVNSARISIDGATSKSYEALRVNSNFETVINNLSKFHKLKEGSKSRLPEIRIEYTAFDANINESVDFVKKYFRLFDSFCLNHLLVTKRNKIFKGNRVSEEKFNSIADEIYKFCKRNKKKFIALFNAVNNKQNYNLKCPIAIEYRALSSNGDIVLCNKEKLCNIFEEDYFKIIKESNLLKSAIDKKHQYCKICMS